MKDEAIGTINVHGRADGSVVVVIDTEHKEVSFALSEQQRNGLVFALMNPKRGQTAGTDAEATTSHDENGR